MLETGKVEVPLSSSYRLLHPRLTVLVSCVDKEGKANVITLAWSMPVSINPPIVAISIAPKRYSHQLVEETKEFVINIPTMDIVLEQQITAGDHTLFIGRVVTAYTDKEIFDEKFDIEKVKPVYHMGGDDFVTLVPEIVSPQL
jgi:flavin reductase (DIM6/NTAB) family NADH-FMN oxidoreductase RutF